MAGFALPKIYPITDTRISGLSHADQVRRFIDGGAELVQLREKHASLREFYRAAVETVNVAHEHGVRVIINDRADVALCAGADGVHLGQDDMPPEAARRVLGERAIIGFSTHTVEQAVEAARDRSIDYIAIGPIFGTTTKTDPDPIVGLEGLRRVRDAIEGVQLVGIGGLTLENAAAVIAAGADSAAIISALLKDPAHMARRMRHFIENIRA